MPCEENWEQFGIASQAYTFCSLTRLVCNYPVRSLRSSYAIGRSVAKQMKQYAGNHNAEAVELVWKS